MRASSPGLPLLLLLAACANSVEVKDPDTGVGTDTDTGAGDTGSIADGAISVSPSRVDLPVIFVGQTGSAALTVTNIGAQTSAVTVSVLGGHADAWTLDAYTSAPAPGASATHTATLTPTAWGDYSVSLVFEDSVSGGRVEVPVSAKVQEDNDADGVGSVATGGEDCDDTVASTYPGAEDAWYDGIDSNCDGANDYDQDGDGYNVGEDCDDTDAATYPGAADAWYDGIDSDCAGDDDFDQDGDGYRDASGGGDDCNDTDASVHPGAADAWYDGLDTDCAGNDDFDQDGDGVNVATDCDGTNAAAYPGATEIWYDGIDEACDGGDDYDQDGDGYAAPSGGGDDCNDTDATITGPVDETIDGIDNDCNGYIDDFPADALASGVLYGTASSMSLGDHGTLAGTGDITGDGAADLVVVAAYGYGYAWVVKGADAASAAGQVTSYDTAQLTGYSGSFPLRYVNGPFADATGDGTADLVVGGKYASAYYGLIYAYEGGSSLAGSIGSSGADAWFYSDSESYSDDCGMGALGDLDGDGLAETVVGSDYDNNVYDERDSGSLAVFTTYSGYHDLGDAQDRIYGDDAYDYLGVSLTVADIDGDGYDDMLSGASGYDDGADDGGAVFMVPGNASLAWSTLVGDASRFVIRGDSRDLALGEDTLAHPGDIDGDGALDIGLTSEDDGSAWLFLDAGALSGDIDASDATHIFSGTAGDLGSSLTLDSDLDGDGDDELVLGADGDDSAGSNAGAVFVYEWSSGWGASLTTSDASLTLWGTAAEQYFGTGSAGGVDLDGDGTEDIAIGAASDDTVASGAGAVFIVPGW